MDLLRRSLRILLHQGGGLQLFKLRHRKQLRILYYHRFQDFTRDWADNFDCQCRDLRAQYSPMSLTEAATRLKNGDPFPRNAVVLTVDDGYRDFLRIAHPILRRYNIPATLYVVSGFLENNDWLWWNVVDYAFQNTPYSSFDLTLRAGPDLRVSWTNAAQRTQTTDTICEALKRLPNDQMREIVEALPGQLKVEMPARKPDYFNALTWEDARSLSQQGVEIGAHTVTHPILPMLESEEAILREVEMGKKQIEAQLQRAADHFCYPNGDFDDRSILAVRQSGFLTATTCRQGFIDRLSNPLTLNRFAAMPNYPARYLGEILAGLPK